jgi:PhnB protein
MPFHPYLFFGGNCRDAFTRYEEIFGGELTIMTMGETPDAQDVPAEQADMVIHAAIVADDLLLMGSDAMSEEFGPVQGMMVTFSTPELGEAQRVFAALSDGGEVTQELIPTFFSPAFGMCVDRFGTPWMVTADQPEGS